MWSVEYRYLNINVLKAFRLMPVSFACDHAQCPTTPYPNFTGKNAKNRFLGTFLIIIVSLTTILKYIPEIDHGRDAMVAIMLEN